MTCEVLSPFQSLFDQMTSEVPSSTHPVSSDAFVYKVITRTILDNVYSTPFLFSMWDPGNQRSGKPLYCVITDKVTDHSIILASTYLPRFIVRMNKARGCSTDPYSSANYHYY